MHPAESPAPEGPDRSVTLADLAATDAFAARIAERLRPGDAVLLEGVLGAGKTTLARAVLRALTDDAALEVPSPSYTLVQSYETRIGAVHHFDLWRLEGDAALAELGWEDARAGVVLVEWPDRLGAFTPADALRLTLAVTGEDSRAVHQAGWAERGLVRARATQRRDFADAHGFGAARIAPLAQDASFRSYWRLTGGPAPAVLMDAPPGREDVRPYLAITGVLGGAGLSVPAVLAADPDQGLVLLEDFGDTLFPALLEREPPQALYPEALYDAATDALGPLAAAAAPQDLPRWDAAAMAASAEATFLGWWWPAAFGAPPAPAVTAEFRAAMAAMLAPLDAAPPALVHRDFFAGNLFWLPERQGARRVGIIDFQDASWGSPAYDLVSLVEDARRDLPEGLAERAIARTLAARPGLPPAGFRAAYAICAAQRHLRVASLWVRLDRRDGKPGYLQHGPRCWALLARALAHPATAKLAGFLDHHVPARLRGNPPPAPA